MTFDNNLRKIIMKQILLLLAFSATFLISSCEGPQGEPGINIYGQVFETSVDFQYNNTRGYYEAPLVVIPGNVGVRESDVILVYRFEGVESDLDVWGQIPQNYFLDDGLIIQYVFNHTFVDVKLFIDGNLVANELDSPFTNNQTFRIAIVPAEYADANLTMHDLLQGLQINPTEIETLY